MIKEEVMIFMLVLNRSLKDAYFIDFLSDEAQWAVEDEGSGLEGSGCEGSGSESSDCEGSGSAEGSDTTESSSSCDSKSIGNGVCQEECNVLQFNFDGGDCLNK